MPPSPSTSLFASDYSVSASNTPSSTRRSPLLSPPLQPARAPQPHPHPQPQPSSAVSSRSASGGVSASGSVSVSASASASPAPPAIPSSTNAKPLAVVFSTDYAVDHNSNPNSASASAPGRTGSSGSDILPARNDSLTAPPRRVSRSRGSIAPVSFTPEDDPLSMAPMLEGDSRRKSSNYLTHEGCMEGESAGYHEGLSSTSSSRALLGRTQSVFPLYRCAPVSTCCPAPPERPARPVLTRRAGGLGHETKSASYKLGTEKAYHHLNRANELFGQALAFKPSNPKAMLARSKVLITLATHYQPPKVATLSLREAVGLLRDLSRLAPRSVFARETLAQGCALLSETTYDTDDTDDTLDEPHKAWNGHVGSLAREALAVMEDVAGDRMDRMRTMRQEEAAQESPSMAEMFLDLSSAAIVVSSLATDLATVDLHVELAEQALDQASNMATVGAAAKIKSSTSSANLITRVQLASNRSSLERLRHTFILGSELDEDDFRSLMSDMTILATECPERVSKLKGSKHAAASTLAWEAIKQLADARLLYASLLRLVWRKRKPARKVSIAPGAAVDRNGQHGHAHHTDRKLSSRNASLDPTTIYEEAEEEDEEEDSPRPENNDDDEGSPAPLIISKIRSDSQHGSPATNAPFPRPEPARLGSHGGGGAGASYSIPATGRRGSWLPTGEHQSGARNRRLSSMTAPLVGPDGISAWNRKASVISLAAEDQAQGLVPSAALAKSAWELLEGGMKQYKLALSILSSSDLPSAQLARAKAETLTAVAYASLFQASLAGRVPIAKEKRTSLLVTAEVYSTWAAREVGWSFLIEGTREAQLADRRTNSWRADEAGKRAVMLLVRVWWHRAVTTESMDVETKSAAKDAVEVVVRRMKDREGVRDGDVVRWKRWLADREGELEPAEALFWRSVSRILRGGAGFVMS